MASDPAQELVVRADVVVWYGRGIVVAETSTPGHSLTTRLIELGATPLALGRAALDDDGSVGPPGGGGGGGGGGGSQPVPVALLIVTSFVTGAAWTPTAKVGARAVLSLIERAETFEDDPARGLALAAALAASGVVALHGPYSDGMAAARAVLERAERPSGGDEPLTGPPEAVQAGFEDLVLQEVMADAAWVPVAVDRPGRTVRFRRFERPFHIGHAGKEPKPTDVTLGLRAVRQAARAFATPARVAFMYHHGYAGSTFLCRLLDTPGVCLGYAEPNVHFHHYDDPDMRALCRRTTAPGETALMKTLPGEMKNAARHFADNEGARGLYLYAPLEDYIASTLRHGYRREYVSAMARNLLGVECDDPGEAAVTWWTWAAREAIALAASRPLRVLAADDFYADVEGAAARVWDWYGFAPRTDWSATIRAVGSTHSKNRSPFSAEDRRVQRREYAEQAQPWLEAHRAELAEAEALRETLARYTV